MGELVVHQAGDVLNEDLGAEQFDCIIMASVAHHFTDAENLLVAKKAYNALKQGGYFTIIEVLRRDTIEFDGDMLSAIGDFFFALSSTSGTWSLNQIKGWQKQGGFTHYKNASFLTIPGYVAVTAKK
jgi:SAM-dependent methyltransferase